MHFFGGTPDNPILTASRTVDGSATGLGDVDAPGQGQLRRGDPLSVAVLADVRFPTGSESNLLGSGAFAARGLAIMSAHFGAFSPHANLGYLYRGGEFENDAVLATVGFDHLLAPWATLAVDVISQLQVGDSPLQVPGPVIIEAPYHRTIIPTVIPDSRDDLVDGSLGIKLTAAPGTHGGGQRRVVAESRGAQAGRDLDGGIGVQFLGSRESRVASRTDARR